MANQLTTNAEALRLFFTEDVYLAKDKLQNIAAPIVSEPVVSPKLAAPLVVPEAVEAPIVIPVVEAPTPQPAKQWQFEYLGKNQKGILILVNDNENKVSTPQGTELLRNLVKAIELTNNDFALVNYANYSTANFQELAAFFNCKLVLSFGVTAVQLALEEKPLHQLHELQKVQFVFTSNLHEMDQESKKMLWATLKQLKNG